MLDHPQCSPRHRSAIPQLAILALVGVLPIARSAFAQEEAPEPPPLETSASSTLPDPLLPQIAAKVRSVTTPDIAALAKALAIGKAASGPAAHAPANALTAIGDLDGDGVPEALLQWAVPIVTGAAEITPAPDSRPLWRVYLLSWDGAQWQVSRLLSGVEDYSSQAINLGAPVERALALVIREGDLEVEYPTVFQEKHHTATLLWDAQSDASRYRPLLQGHVSFRDRAAASAEMIVTGRADPGLLQVKPRGHRGFTARTVYRWEGNAFNPATTEYAANQDYTVYRFIAALHLHDYSSAYALVVPEEFLQSDSPTLPAFRKYIQDNFAEFLQNEVFEAPEPPAGSWDDHRFVLSKSDARNVYHPSFSNDGKFLMTGLTRTHEAQQ